MAAAIEQRLSPRAIDEVPQPVPFSVVQKRMAESGASVLSPCLANHGAHKPAHDRYPWMILRSKNTKNLTNEVRRIFWRVNNFQASMKYNVDRKT